MSRDRRRETRANTEDEPLLDIVPVTRRGERGMLRIIARANYEAWLQKEGPGLVAEGYVRLIVTEHVRYQARQFTIADRERLQEDTRG